MLKLEDAMKEKGVGVTELAERLGVNRQTVYYYIKQGDKNPLSQLQKIAYALGISVLDLIVEEKEEGVIICPNCGKRFKMEESHIPHHENIRGKEYYQ
ncbi:MAG: Cro/C1-type DNA-binding domain [Bacteroidetes bacterium]|jgi:transcriptional regulator with XRE-family HTH domain|nr:Cro/C1-type DNA-binding domain [Bacteroidota bacterium]